VGSRFIFREGLTKGIGKVTKIIEIDETDEALSKTVTFTNDLKHDLSPQKLKVRNNISPVNHEVKKLFCPSSSFVHSRVSAKTLPTAS
jgi:hypothetical protein